jgi:hypothetical protein
MKHILVECNILLHMDKDPLSYLGVLYIFRCMTSMFKQSKVVRNEFHTTTITKLWPKKFVMIT